MSAKLSAGLRSAGQGREEMGIYSRTQGEQPPAANVLWVGAQGNFSSTVSKFYIYLLSVSKKEKQRQEKPQEEIG